MATNIGQNRIFGTVPRSRRRAATRLTSPTPSVQGKATPTRNEIAKRAYELWRDSGCQHGRDVEHWLEAERQLSHQS